MMMRLAEGLVNNIWCGSNRLIESKQRHEEQRGKESSDIPAVNTTQVRYRTACGHQCRAQLCMFPALLCLRVLHGNGTSQQGHDESRL